MENIFKWCPFVAHFPIPKDCEEEELKEEEASQEEAASKEIEEATSEEITPTISCHALAGISTPQTLNIEGYIKKKKVTI